MMKTETMRRENIDIGHHSYTEACKQLETSPLRIIIQQLQGRDIHLQHVGLKPNDAIALSYALLVSSV